MKIAEHYTYKDYTDTITNLCRIFGKSETEVKAKLNNGYDVSRAIEESGYTTQFSSEDLQPVRTRRKNVKSLSTEAKEYINKYLEIPTEICNKYKITDEDNIQEIYLEFSEIVGSMFETKYTEGKTDKQLKQYIENALRHYIRGLKRYDVWKSEFKPEESIVNSDDYKLGYDRTNREIDNIVLNKYLEDLQNSIKSNQWKVFINRIGLYGDTKTLEEIGQEMGITRARVREIEKTCVRRIHQYLITHNEIKDFYSVLSDICN